MLPVQNLLVVNELRALSVGTLGSKMLVLKQLEDVQTLRVSVKIGQKNKVNVPSVQFQPIFTLKTERIVALSSSLDTLNSWWTSFPWNTHAVPDLQFKSKFYNYVILCFWLHFFIILLTVKVLRICQTLDEFQLNLKSFLLLVVAFWKKSRFVWFMAIYTKYAILQILFIPILTEVFLCEFISKEQQFKTREGDYTRE